MESYMLQNGMQVPAIGFGTYNEQNGDNLKIIKTAIEAGYRYFDTASLYETERFLGQALKESGLPREEFIVASKVWIDEMGYEETKAAFARSLERLQMDYLDLYLIHWPRDIEGGENWKERIWDTWRAMEELYEAGKIKGLGLSNFLPHHIKVVLEKCKIRPQVDQLELHPGYSQEAAARFCKENDILPQAWSPLGRGRQCLTDNDILGDMAKKYGKSFAQISLRFLVQKGIMPLPKSSSMERMKQNMDVFDFELTEEDLSMLTCMPQTTWLGEHPDYSIPKVKCNRNQ